MVSKVYVLEVPGNQIRQVQTEGDNVWVYDKEKDGRGKSGECVWLEKWWEKVNNCGGLVAPIHTTDLILL